MRSWSWAYLKPSTQRGHQLLVIYNFVERSRDEQCKCNANDLTTVDVHLSQFTGLLETLVCRQVWVTKIRGRKRTSSLNYWLISYWIYLCFETMIFLRLSYISCWISWPLEERDNRTTMNIGLVEMIGLSCGRLYCFLWCLIGGTSNFQSEVTLDRQTKYYHDCRGYDSWRHSWSRPVLFIHVYRSVIRAFYQSTRLLFARPFSRNWASSVIGCEV